MCGNIRERAIAFISLPKNFLKSVLFEFANDVARRSRLMKTQVAEEKKISTHFFSLKRDYGCLVLTYLLTDGLKLAWVPDTEAPEQVSQAMRDTFLIAIGISGWASLILLEPEFRTGVWLCNFISCDAVLINIVQEMCIFFLASIPVQVNY